MRGLRFGVFAVIGVLVLGGLLSTFFTVAPYERVVVTRAGAFSYVAEPGLHFKLPFIDSTQSLRMDTQQFNTEPLNTYTIDNQEVDAILGVQYRIPQDQIEFVFTNNRDYAGKLLSMVIDRWKIEAGKVNVSDIANNRGQLVRAVNAVVKDEANRLFHLEVMDVQLLNLEYQKSFRDAQASAAVVKTQIESAQGLQLKAKIDADTLKITAIGQANVVIEQQRGNAEATVLNARANAEATRLQGDANAQAQLKMAEALKANESLVELRKADRWNGVLPQNIYAGAPIPFLNRP